MTNFNDNNYYHVNFGAGVENDTKIRKWRDPERIKKCDSKPKEPVERRTKKILGKYTDLLSKEKQSKTKEV